jgi:hypothetical protein
VAQTGLVLLMDDRVNRWLERPRVWLAVAWANSMIMTFYLWNMSAVVLAAVLVFPTGIAPQPEPLSTAWWLLRPPWLLLCAACLVPFLLAFRWAERPVVVERGPVPAAAALVGAVASAAGLAVLAREAFPVQGEVVFWPAIGVALVVLGALALRIDALAPLRRPREAKRSSDFSGT